MELTKEHFHAYIFIGQRRGLSAKQTSRQLHEANCENSPSESTVHCWCSKLRQERSSLADDSRSAWTAEFHNNGRADRSCQAANRREPQNLSLRILPDDLGLSKDSTRRILINHLGKRSLLSLGSSHPQRTEQARQSPVCETHHLSGGRKFDRGCPKIGLLGNRR